MEQSEYVRDDLSSMLPQMVEDEQPRSLSSGTVDEIASLLADDLDAVRANAAAALGTIGPPAARAVPVLMRALKRAEDEFIRPGLRPGSFSGDQICEALQRIGTPQQDTPCQFFPGTSVPGTYSGRAQ